MQTYGSRPRFGPYSRQAVRFVGRWMEQLGGRIDLWSWGFTDDAWRETGLDLRLERIIQRLAHDLGSRRPGQRWRRVRDGARRPVARPSVAERLAPYTHRPRHGRDL